MLKKITWLGQAGLLFESEGSVIMVDPYLSDSVVKINPRNYRRVAVDESFFEVRPDVLAVTHDHLDHLDPETLPRFLQREGEPIAVLGSTQSFGRLLQYAHGHNYINMVPGNEWTITNECGEEIRITALPAFHSEPTAVGYIIDFDGQRHYITGDTLYNEQIFAQLPSDIYALYLPVNGVGNNMNLSDAARFSQRVGAQHSVALHFGMFDELSVSSGTLYNGYVPEIYKEIEIL